MPMNAKPVKAKEKHMLTEFAKTYKPFLYPQFMDYANKHELIHWAEEEVDLGDDVSQWNSGAVNEVEKKFVLQIMRLFTQTDVQVGQNYCDLFIPVFKNNEVRCMLLAFAAREGIHQRAYALFTDTIGLPEHIYSEFLEYDEMAAKISMMQDNKIDTQQNIAKALAQTVCNEGMSLFSSFVMLLNFQRFGKMKGLCSITEWSLRDESQHVLGMSELFKQYCKENPQVLTDDFKLGVYQMYRDAVALEDAFIDDAFKLGSPEGITAMEVKQYIRFIANRRLVQLGFKDNWSGITNPFPWLDWIVSEGQTNFFEATVSEYSVSGMKGKWNYGDKGSKF